jgi:ATP-binding cassette, subfamily B (MDR/TAP), member 1
MLLSHAVYTDASRGSKNVRSGEYTQRDFFTVLPALLFSAQAAGQLFSLAPEITRAKTAAQSVFSLHDEQPTILNDYKPSLSSVDDYDNVDRSDGHAQDAEKGQLEFRHVSLRYESRPNVFALNDVSFLVKPGQYAAFVGRSGAGKSSAMHLIERFYDPSQGEVLLDGKNIRKDFVQDHRARLGLVEQEPDLFPGSVEFNIRLGAKPGAKVSHEDVEAVTKKCGLHDFIMSLPEGYNTEVGSHGSKLSGGQRQRLAIARALIRDPEVLLLDEATSQLDATTEREVRIAIAAATSGRTTIMIAHRLSSVQHADRIFVFEHGQIAEQGTHDELVAFGGLYAGMVAAQELD